jgi:LemA protein
MLVVGILIVLILISVFGITMYNGLIRLRNQLERAWSNIDVVLKQRYDEIPQLIQVIEQFVGHEAGVLKALVEARAHYGSARNVSEKIKASSEMSIALGGILALGEAYPDLKSNQNFLQLQSRVSHLENTIADRRESYNEAVTNFNTRIDQFPDILAARILGYQRQMLFQVTAAERTAPSLKMNLPKMGT